MQHGQRTQRAAPEVPWTSWLARSPGSDTPRSASTRPAGERVYVDPFLNGNPTCPDCGARAGALSTLILVTHGHGDHVGDTVALAQRVRLPGVAQVELRGWLAAQGVADDGMAHSINKGGHRSPSRAST